MELVTPYKVKQEPNDVHYTYLDTVGRPVVVINVKNSVDNHIQDFQVNFFRIFTDFILKTKSYLSQFSVEIQVPESHDFERAPYDCGGLLCHFLIHYFRCSNRFFAST